MLARNGMCAAIEQVLTLPIRGAPYTIEPGKGDKGEADFVQSVMMTPDESGGMKTPISELLGQITSAQIFRRAFFLAGRENIQDQRVRRADNLRQSRLPAAFHLPGQVQRPYRRAERIPPASVVVRR